MTKLRRASAFLLLAAIGCSDTTAPAGNGFAAGRIQGQDWKADTALALLQDSTLVLGGIRHYGAGRIDGFTVVAHGFRLPMDIELAEFGSGATGFLVNREEDAGTLEPEPVQATDSVYRGLLHLEALSPRDSLLTGTVAFATAPKYQYASQAVAIHFRMRLMVVDHSPVAARPSWPGSADLQLTGFGH